MENTLWLFEHTSRAFQELRQSISAIWDDQAAREISARFLEPHASDSADLVSNYKNQQNSTNDSKRYIAETNEHIQKIKQFTDEISRYLTDASYYSSNASSVIGKSRQYTSEASAKFLDIQSQIDSANACWSE